ncbi:MAG: phenylalanine--tRNA ligase subunit alpha, partial [Sphingomicrobium sp.]
MTTDPDTLRNDWTKRIAEAGDAGTLEALRVAALGKAGDVTALLKTMGALSPEERQERGPKIHALREAVSAALAAKKDALDNVELDRRLATERVDLSLPPRDTPRGSIHPVSQVMDELA